jgi:hypothetical protein
MMSGLINDGWCRPDDDEGPDVLNTDEPEEDEEDE